MAWFEAHDTMARHPKTLKLARLLGTDRRYAVGLLHDLFSWGLYAADKTGALPGLTAQDIAQAMDWPVKKGEALVEALVEAGYLERSCGGAVVRGLPQEERARYGQVILDAARTSAHTVKGASS